MTGNWLSRRRFMREHRWTHGHLSEYIDGDLSERQRHRVEEHVGICPQCTRVLNTLRRMLESLMCLTPEPHPSVVEGVVRRLRDEH